MSWPKHPFLGRLKMTLCGAFRCRNGVVVFADRQESIADYAKWDTGKIYLYTLEGRYRVVMTGAGESHPIDEVWDKLEANLWSIQNFADVKPAILRVVSEVTRKTIFPVPRDERLPIDLIWAVQPLGKPVAGGREHHIQLFNTFRLSTIKIETNYFTGNPRLLAQYINEQYFHGYIIELQDAEALAAYMLWEAKEYDLYCGKYSDIFRLDNNDSLGLVTRRELEYWDDHWRQVKASIGILPLLSCVGSDRIYNISDRLQSLTAAIKVLQLEQRKMRQEYRPERTELERKVNAALRKVANRRRKQKSKKLMRSLASQKSGPGQ